MTRIFCALMLYLYFLNVHAQSRSDISQLKTVTISPKKMPVPDLITGFTEVEIMDVRPDDHCLGFMEIGNRKKHNANLFDGYSGILTTNGITKDLEACFSITGMKGFSLLACIRECWLFENDYDLKKQDFNVEKPRATCGLLFKMDVYLKKDQQYLPLARIDTIFRTEKTLLSQSNNLLLKAFGSFAEKLKNLPVATIYAKSTQYRSKSSIDSFYTSLNTITPFTDTDTSNQYIVESFEDFRQGRFTKTKLQYSSDKLGDYFYKKDANGNEYPVTPFGIVTGGQFYVRTNNSYSIMFLHKNRLYTIGSKMVEERTTWVPIMLPLVLGGMSGGLYYDLYAVGGEAIANNSRRNVQPMMMDFSTGKIY